MKLLLITGIFPPDPGGPALYVPNLATDLARRGHDVEVLCLSDSLDHDDSAYPFRVYRIRRRTFYPWRLWLTTFLVWRLSRGKDLVYINGLACEAMLGARLRRCRLVQKVVGDHAWERARGRGWFDGTLDDYQTASKGLRLRMLDLIRTLPLRSAKRVIVPSGYLKGIVCGWGINPRKVQVIYNAVSGSEGTPHKYSLPQWSGQTCITVCRLTDWKGVDKLIDAIAGIPAMRLVIAGDGYLRPELEAQARALNVSDRVLFLGHVESRAVPQVLRQADVFVLNSSYEGLPHVVLEAMEAGVPVVATDAGGTGEVVEDGATGLLVSVGDTESLRASITRLCEDQTLARSLVSEARRRLREKFNIEAMVAATEQALEDVATGSSSVVQSETTPLSVLSFGYSSNLWAGESAEDYKRLMAYAEQIDQYICVTNSYKRHGLKPCMLGGRLEAIPTNAWCPVDSLLRMLWIGCKVLRKRKISLIQAADPIYCGVVAVLLGKMFRVPVNIVVYGPNVYDEHWVRSHWRNRLMSWIGRFVLRSSHGIQVDGRMTARSLIDAGCHPDRVRTKPMVPTNLAQFMNVNRERPTDDVPVRLLYVGRFANQKNLPMMLSCVKAIESQLGRQIELLLVGAGPEEEKLRARIKRDGLEARVQIKGPVSRGEIADIFAAADIFVLTSNYEGFPRVLMEAAASALPIVTTAVSGSDEAVVDGVTGYVVPVGDQDAFIEKVTRLIECSELRSRMGSAGRNLVTTWPDPSRNAPAQVAIWRGMTEAVFAP
jgi:glycosyltransferase involved in cell wall biosynthesis